MFGFIKKGFVVVISFVGGITLSATPLSAAPLKCISMNNPECKVCQKLLMLIVVSLYFILLVLKQVNPVVVVIILMIHKQKYVFLML